MNDLPENDRSAFASPNTFLGTICCLCVCATIVFIAYVSGPRPQPARRLWTPMLIDTNGDTLTMGESRQIEFWTPSVETRDYLHKENGRVVPTETWQVISNDDVVRDFGMLLHSNSYVLGYRRFQVWGQGQTSYKPGWWWTVNVFTNYTANDLARTYESFWKCHQILFVEVIDNRGNDDSSK